MKTLLLASVVIMSAATSAMAADMAPPVYDWTGFYVGANAGAAWNNSTIKEDVTVPGAFTSLSNKIENDQTVFTGGGIVGYNWQMDHFVMGLEGDFNYLGFGQHKNRDFGGGVTSHLSMDENWYGTMRARAGYAANNFLFYGTGGLAYGNVNASARIDTPTDSWRAENSNVKWGWTLGAGMEYAFDQNWTAGAEYMYVDLGKSDLSFRHLNGIDTTEFGGNVNTAFSVIRATVKYKF
jgi:outer membrane immunogenic protein